MEHFEYMEFFLYAYSSHKACKDGTGGEILPFRR